MLCWRLVEQARYEHMSDEYKNRNIIDVPPSPSWVKVRDTTLVHSITKLIEESQPDKRASQKGVI